jgi:hypothetical protein
LAVTDQVQEQAVQLLATISAGEYFLHRRGEPTRVVYRQ